jgi:hypothetical protein
MIYKILIIKNNLKKKFNFSKGIEWFKKNTPIEIKIEEIETSLSLTFEKKSNDTFSGYTVDEKVKDELRNIVPRYKYNAVCLLYGDKTPGIRVSIADKTPLYPETDFIEIVKLDKGETFNHELFHVFFHRLRRQGINLEDPMDKVVVDGKVKHYYNNNSLTSKPSNRTIALERLSPYWSIISNMDNVDVIIKREEGTKKQILGKLTAVKNGATFSCESLELPDLNNQPNISCIPKGTYDVKWTFSPRFMKYTYEIIKVPDRSGIRFHAGNYYHQINGCILLGMARQDIDKDGEIDVLNSIATIKSFEGFMLKQPFKLRIE